MFYCCTVIDTDHITAHDDVAAAFFIPLKDVNPQDFGLASIRRGLQKIIDERIII